jgi:hypothetical protein
MGLTISLNRVSFLPPPTQIYEPIIFVQSRPGADPDFLKRGANRGTQTQRLNFIENIISDRRRKK